MSYKLLLRIDAFIGIPICFFLTIYQLVKNKLRSNKSQSKKVAILKFAEMGATIHAYSSIKAICDKFTPDNVYFICFKESEEILYLLELLPEKQILTLRVSNPFVFLIDCVVLRFKVTRLKIDTIFDFEFFTHAAPVLCYFLGISKKIGIVSKRSKHTINLYDIKICHDERWHISQYYQHLAQAAVGRFDTEHFKIKHYQDRKKFSENAIEKFISQNLKDFVANKLVLINMGFCDDIPLRVWPKEHFAELIKKIILNHKDVLIGVIGKKESVSFVHDFVAGFEGEPVVDLTKQCPSLEDFIFVLSKADILISSDSGPIHFANIIENLRTIALFGPETPELFSPKNNRTTDIYLNLDCSPCFSVFKGCLSDCKKNICLSYITVDHIYGIFKNMINEIKADHRV